MEKPDQVCNLGRLQHLSIGKVQQKVGDDGSSGQGQQQHARVPGACVRAHGEFSLEERENNQEIACSSHCRIRRSTPAAEPQERGAKLSFAIDRRYDLGSHLTSLSLFLLSNRENSNHLDGGMWKKEVK